MKKYFIVSDIHSFYEELHKALWKSGFRKTNKDHILIVCGDVFDRGDETLEVYQFLSSLPKNRCILIRGNHESLYNELLNKDFPDSYDGSNGTLKTFCDIADINIDLLTRSYYYINNDTDNIGTKIQDTWDSIKEKVRKSKITKWINSSQWVDYYELDNFIFVHSFIPTYNPSGLPGYYVKASALQENPNWREADSVSWEDAKWGCPWKQYKAGLFNCEEQEGKILVCGHWHVSDFWENLKGIFDHNNELYYSKHFIGLDGGVSFKYTDNLQRVLFHKQNVLVIDGDKLYNQEGTLLDLNE